MDELTRSDTASARGIDNAPSAEHLRNIEEAVKALLDPLREAWGAHCTANGLGTPAIRISSGYRGFRLNESVGGASASAHCVGYAFDMIPMNQRMPEFRMFCRDFVGKMPFDQLISEDEGADRLPKWMHIGFRNRQGAQRRQFLTMRGGKYYPMS